MIVELSAVAALIVVAGAIGFAFGKSYTGDKTTARLRKRGYTIKAVKSYGYHSGYRFVYNGFSDRLQSIMTEGPVLELYDDAVANADAHYYAKTIKDSTFDINKLC